MFRVHSKFIIDKELMNYLDFNIEESKIRKVDNAAVVIIIGAVVAAILAAAAIGALISFYFITKAESNAARDLCYANGATKVTVTRSWISYKVTCDFGD